MKTIEAKTITQTVKELCIKASIILPNDIKSCLTTAREQENFVTAKNVLDDIIENYNYAQQENMPICQDTGVACIFVEIGQEVYVSGNLEDAINQGVREGYIEGYLRKSVVADPLDRVNTKDNTPAIITYDIVEGNDLKITVAPKGAGSENMSKIVMLKPAEGVEGVKRFVIEAVKSAGANPCPPIVVGVGIGGNFDKVASLAKKALLRSADSRNTNPFYSNLEEELLQEINKLGIGPQGFGGKTTALCVNIETHPTHIAQLPCAVNINCHVTRHASAVL